MNNNQIDLSWVFEENTIPYVKQLSEIMPGGFFMYHADGNEELIHINSAMLRIFGCDSEEEFRELTGFTFRGLVHPEDIDRVEESIAKQIKENIHALDYVEYRIVQKNGNVRWVEDYGHFFHTESYGDVFCVFIDDATERLKKCMVELETKNNKLRNAYASESQYKKAILHDAVCFFELNLTKDECIATTAQTTGRQEDYLFDFMEKQTFVKYSEYIEFWINNIESTNLEEYKKFFDPKRLIQCYDKGELEQIFEGWINDSMGRKHLCHYVILLGKNEFSNDIIALFIAKDITEQVEKQNLLKTALRQAESANLARNVFLANMSHDIRTPLNAIIGYTELVHNNLSNHDKIKYYIDKIRLAGEQLLDIVDESLEVTHMESSKLNLKESECHIADLLSEVKKSMHSAIEAKSLEFIVDTSQVEHFVIIADFIRLREILCKLLDNAVKYTNPGGRISLTVTETTFDFSDYGKYQFVVEDTGIGISKDFMDVLFEPFKRENNTTQSGVLGTGLGLTVVKNLVDMMDGSIEVESEPNKGSKFMVNLLLKLQKDQTSFQRTNPDLLIDKETLKGKRILLVEDNEINSEIAKELLGALGYLVETAQNGSIALDMVKNSKPKYYALVLMDIQMPVMDGYTATKAIRELEDTELAHIPIIALSANAYAEDYHKSLEAGMNAHFPKPIDINNLQEIIQTVLSIKQEQVHIPANKGAS